MAVNITIDSLVKRSIAEHRLTLHYYVPFLLYAKRALDELRMNTLGTLKTATITIDPTTMQGDLPSDYIDEVSVGVTVGDKIKQIGHGEALTKEDGSFDPVSDYEDFSIDYINQFSDGLLYGADGGVYGLGVEWVDEYTINRSTGKIRINNKSDIDTVYLVYIGEETLVNGGSVVHPFAQEAIMNYTAYKFAESNPRNRFDPQIKKREFNIERKKLRASLNKMTPTDVKRSIRREFMQSVKN